MAIDIRGEWVGYFYRERDKDPCKFIQLEITQSLHFIGGVIYDQEYNAHDEFRITRHEILGMITGNNIKFRQSQSQTDLNDEYIHYIGHFLPDENYIDGSWKSCSGKTGSFTIYPQGDERAPKISINTTNESGLSGYNQGSEYGSYHNSTNKIVILLFLILAALILILTAMFFFKYF